MWSELAGSRRKAPGCGDARIVGVGAFDGQQALERPVQRGVAPDQIGRRRLTPGRQRRFEAAGRRGSIISGDMLRNPNSASRDDQEAKPIRQRKARAGERQPTLPVRSK